MAEIRGLTPAEARRKTLVGRVVSDKMDKTVVVTVERLTRHPLYHKTIKQTNRFMAHDEHESCQVGDLVRIVETRPQSRHKRWRVVEILSHDASASAEVASAAAVPSLEEGGEDAVSGEDVAHDIEAEVEVVE